MKTQEREKKCQFTMEVGLKTHCADIAATIARRAMATAGELFGEESLNLASSLVLWLVRAEGLKVGPMGLKLLGNDNEAEDTIRMRVMLDKVIKTPLRWEKDLLSLIEDVAYLLAPGGFIWVDSGIWAGERFLIFQAPNPDNAMLTISVQKVVQIGAQQAFTSLCEEALTRANGFLPNLKMLAVHDNTKTAWQGLLTQMKNC